MTLKNHVLNIRDFLLDLLFPVFCQNCHKEGEYLCAKCQEKIILNKKSHCPECKKANEFGNYCRSCQENFYLKGVWISASYHDQLLKKLIKKYKYSLIKELTTPLSQVMIDFLSDFLTDESSKKLKILDFRHTVIIPVPLHKRRIAWRGFNQSEELASLVAQKFSIEHNNHQLIRSKNTSSQTRFDRQTRIKNIGNAFAWNGPKLEKKYVILIDDVITTGTTLNECAKILRQNGAKEVWGLVLGQN